MPFALLIIGAVTLISAVKNTQGDLVGLIKKDFSNSDGQPSFIYWLVAILVIGAVGYIPKIKPLSVAFLGLLVLVMFLAKGDPSKASGGFFEKFTQAINTSATAAAPAAAPASTVIGPGSTALPPVKMNLPDIPSITSMVQ